MALYSVMNAFDRGGWAVRLLVSMTVGPVRQFCGLIFVRCAEAASGMKGVGWMSRTSYWVSPDETGLLAPRLGAKFCSTRPI